jgi:hypothetical protein
MVSLFRWEGRLCKVAALHIRKGLPAAIINLPENRQEVETPPRVHIRVD